MMTGLVAFTQGIRVSTAEGDLSYPWAGGMNSCQFGEVDLDRDGAKDIIVFERNGNRILPFLNEGFAGEVSLTFAPEYASLFPELVEWAVFADYDNDGRTDIFTYSPGFASMKVYRNISQEDLKFDLVVFPFLTSLQGAGYVNILVTNADYPAIVDIDDDGDLDILTFWGLGSFIEHHKNLSIEKYGHADSLDYERVELCWGYFAESEESNVITLDTCIGGLQHPAPSTQHPPPNHERHTGSTFLVMDINGDQVKDLILGDVDYPNPIMLMNGGTLDSAYMISQDNTYPNETRAIWLFSMPVLANIDMNNDGLKDLIASPFDPNQFVTSGYPSVWYYQNSGSNDIPVYSFQEDDFLQGEMIDVGSGAYPVLEDYDGDGLPDLFIGNYGRYDSSWYDQSMTLYSGYTGRIALFINRGTEGDPSFERISENFANCASLGLKGIVPAFGDLDEDGDMDMLVGNENGTLVYYRNNGGLGNPMEMQFVSQNFLEIAVGEYSAPALYDLDGDGKRDLVVGERKGNLNYYRNTGSQGSPGFTYVTDSLGKINVTDPNISLDGYSVPMLFDDRGKTGLVVGSEQGDLYYFTGIDGNLGGPFTESDSLFENVAEVPVNPDRGYRTSAWVSDIDGDGNVEVVAGNFAGGLEFFSRQEQPPVNLAIDEEGYFPFRIYPNPAKSRLSIESIESGSGEYDIELISINGAGQSKHYQNAAPSFTIDVSTLQPGIWLVKINTGNRIYYRKVALID
jgi:hypothetical protein